MSSSLVSSPILYGIGLIVTTLMTSLTIYVCHGYQMGNLFSQVWGGQSILHLRPPALPYSTFPVRFYSLLTVSLHFLGARVNDSKYRTWKRQEDDSKPDLPAKNVGGGKQDVIGFVPSVDTAWKPTPIAS